ncbi:serine/threonine-protein kinase Sgk1 isoform X1 [Lithobates pipiens]
MVNKDMNGFPVKKCSAFQFFKKRVRRWIKKPTASKDKHQSKHLKYTPVPTVMHIATTQEEAEYSLCHSYLDDPTFESFKSPHDKQVNYWESQTSCTTGMKACKQEVVSLSEDKTFWNSNETAFMKQRRMGLNDFIQKISTNTYTGKHNEVQSILNISQPSEPELLNGNPSPPPSPSQQINLGPSSNPHAKPSDFQFLKIIGKGSFGKVLLARHTADEKFYAVKVLQKKAILKKKEEKHIMSERNVLLKNVKHPFLVGLHFSFQTSSRLYFILDYINGGELFYHLQRERCFLEPRARFYAAEIASALGYLHSLNIVYRDLKPENILLDSQGHIVLTDFGLCKENIEPNGTTSTFCGTPEYLAPEVLHKQPYDRTVDWWCLGAVLYEMLYGLPPFYSRNTAEMYDNILNKPLQLKPNITNSARNLLEGLLQKDRTKRLGAKNDFMEIKNHIFFSPINWDDLINKKITPPFNPNVSGPSDLQHFDPEFTEEPVPNSIGQSPDSILITASIKEAAEAFMGFSYAPPMESFL